MIRRAEAHILIAVLAASLACKLIVLGMAAAHPQSFTARDTMTYLDPAHALLDIARYASSSAEPETPETLRTPGYPLFIALIFQLTERSWLAVIVVQIGLSLVTMLCAYKLGNELESSKVGLLAVVFLALDVTSLAYSLLLLTETLFTFWLVVAWWAAARYQQNRDLKLRRFLLWPALLGIALGISVLVRPITYYLALPMLVWIGLVARRRCAPWRLVAASVLAFTLPWMILVGGWQWRNQRLTGFPTLSGIEGVNMLFFRGAAIVAERDDIDMEEARRLLGRDRYHELHPQTASMTREEINQIWVKEGKKLIIAHPLIFLRTQIDGAISLLTGLGHHTLVRILGVPLPETGPLGDLRRLSISDYLKRWLAGHPGLFIATMAEELYLFLLYLGAALWWITALRCRRFTMLDGWSWLVLFYLVGISAGPEAYARFRVPIMPILAVYSALGWSRLFQVKARV